MLIMWFKEAIAHLTSFPGRHMTLKRRCLDVIATSKE